VSDCSISRLQIERNNRQIGLFCVQGHQPQSTKPRFGAPGVLIWLARRGAASLGGSLFYARPQRSHTRAGRAFFTLQF
jgi:hypothetical protein